MVNRNQAIALVETNGTALERAHLHWVVAAVEPERAVFDALAALQSTDGGFPLGMVAGRRTSVDSTLTALWWMEELGQLEPPGAGVSGLTAVGPRRTVIPTP